MIDFVIPQWLVIYYYSIGTVSLLLNSLTIYLIVYRSDKIDSFRYFILVFQVNLAVTDAHTTILMQPFPLTPMICGYYKGLIGSFFNVNTYYHVAFSITSIITQVQALIFCFYRKHQTIAKVMNGHVCSKTFTHFMNTSATVTPIFYTYALVQAGMTREEQLDFVKKEFPEYLVQFTKVTNPALFSLNIWLESVLIYSGGGGFISSFAFSATTFDLFRMLRSMRKRVSAYNYKRHKAAVHSLFAQFIASSVLLVPPFVYMIVSTGGYGNGQIAIQLILAVFSLRGIVNGIVLIVTTPPYRKFVFRMKPRPVSVAVSSAGNSTNPLQQ